MRVKSVSELCGNEILAEPVLTDEKMILISRGSRLKKEYVPLIRSLGIDTLMVEDPYENYEMPSRIIDYSVFGKFVERVQRVMENHIYHKNKSLREFEVIANEVVKEVSKIPENIIIDINARIVNLYEHTVMVTLVSVFVARLLHLDQVRQYNIAVGALLHDLGLRYITTGYVNRDWEKEDPIEAFEYKKHTILGYSALDEESWIPEVSKRWFCFIMKDLMEAGFRCAAEILQWNAGLFRHAMHLTVILRAWSAYGFPCRMQSERYRKESYTSMTGKWWKPCYLRLPIIR